MFENFLGGLFGKKEEVPEVEGKDLEKAEYRKKYEADIFCKFIGGGEVDKDKLDELIKRAGLSKTDVDMIYASAENRAYGDTVFSPAEHIATLDNLREKVRNALAEMNTK